MIPDKIYIYAKHPEPYWFGERQLNNDIEYIRKDALLERIKERLKLYDPDDPEEETACYELQSIIRYLNQKEETK